MVKYDAHVITQMAGSLYDHADSLIRVYSVLGFLLGFAMAGVPSLLIFRNGPAVIVAGMLLGAIGLAVGHSIGTNAAFKLRFQAQEALVMAEIERNTRQPR